MPPLPADKPNRALYIGLMSGTSMDGIDAAIIECGEGKTHLVASHEQAIPADIRSEIAQISNSGENEIERMGQLDRNLGELFARTVLQLLESADINARQITAIGSHGQTIRHRPPSAADTGERSFTLQIGDPNTIAEKTGITTVADFRRRDIAAGGEGAPLAPAFHAAAFSRAGVNRAIVNIGGIANVSVLEGTQLLAGFDTGPGNTLLDHWIERELGNRYDSGGQWAAEGQVETQLLEQLLDHPYLAKTGPRSTGKEVFNLNWLEQCLGPYGECDPQNIQATLAQFTAQSIAHGLNGCSIPIEEIYVCGGGAHNTDLMRRIYREVGSARLATTSVLGLDPDWVEAAAFGWLAHQTLQGLPGNAPQVTGAEGLRVLGGVFPGASRGTPTIALP
jgi:anhydro-N-acetylmuramic acid kinase